MRSSFLPINSIYLVFSSLEMQRRLIQTNKVSYKRFYSVRKETSHKPLKVAAPKKSFSSVYIIDTTCFKECFLFHVITGRHYFYANLLLPGGLVQSPCCCVLWDKCFERSPYFIMRVPKRPFIFLQRNTKF